MTEEENPWIECSKELPPCDGIYNITNGANDPYGGVGVIYDGFGFIFEGIYRHPKFWRYRDQLNKKYGKQND
jgi:hypothetical protein